MRNCGLLSHIGSGDDEITFNEGSFVDNVAIPIASSACEILDKVSDITECAIRIFTGYGMELNFLPNKSEVVVAVRGPGAKRIKQAKEAIEANETKKQELVERGDGAIEYCCSLTRHRMLRQSSWECHIVQSLA